MERRQVPTDYLLFNLTLALLVIGVVMVFDTSYARSMDFGSDTFVSLRRQAIYAGVGLVAMLLVMRLGYWKLRRWSAILLFIALCGLIAVWIPPIGIERNGAARWIGFGPVQIQPSEFAKLALVLYLAALLSRNLYDIRDFADGLAVPLAVVGLFVILVEREPDMGTAAVIGLSSLTMLYLAGARKRHLLSVCAAALLLAVVATLAHGYRMDRIIAFTNPEAYYENRGYQLTRGLLAVGSGGLLGLGLGAGREKFYLPEANTDFIFATIAEETGLWGSLLVVGLLFLLGWRGFAIARRTRDTFGAMVAAGISATISWQALLNIGVVTGSIPSTGVPLPFISAGGSSLVFLLVSVGILLNIAQHPEGSVKRAS